MRAVSRRNIVREVRSSKYSSGYRPAIRSASSRVAESQDRLPIDGEYAAGVSNSAGRVENAEESDFQYSSSVGNIAD